MTRSLVAVVTAAAVALLLVSAAAAIAPTAVTGAATSVGARSAVVGGRVDPGGEATSWFVEYGTTTSYGARTAARSAGNGTAAVDVTEQLTGLETGAPTTTGSSPRTAAARAAAPTRRFTTRGAPEVVTAAACGARPDRGERSAARSTRTGARPAGGSSTARRRGTAPAPTPALREPARAPSACPSGSSGLHAGETYHFRLVASNDLGTVHGADKSFRTDPAPAVATGGVDEVSISSARVHGSVDPRGRGTVAWFEYGTTRRRSATGRRTSTPGSRHARRACPPRSAGSSPARATTTASSHAATRGRSPVRHARSRRAPARSSITGAAQLSGASVVLAGTVDPVGRATSWWFELGTTTSYGTSTVVRSAGAGRGAVAVSETVAGLTPGAEYHARLVARSSAGNDAGLRTSCSGWPRRRRSGGRQRRASR